MAQVAQCVGAYAPGSYVPQFGGLKTQQVMEDRTQGRLVARGGGEWRRPVEGTPPEEAYLHDEHNWVVPFANALRHAYGVPEVGDGTKYADFVVRIFLATLYLNRVRQAVEGGKLPEPPYDKWADEDFGYFKQVTDHEGRKRQVLYMRGVPSPLAHKTFSGVPFGWTAEYEQLVVPVIRRMLRKHPETIVQWELPAEMAFGSIPFASVKLRQRLFTRMMDMYSRIISQLPEGTQHSFHLCWGDLRRRPFVPRWLQSWKTNVALINAILSLKVWSFNGGKYRLFAIHDPQADGRHAAKFTWFRRRAYKKLVAFPKHVIYAFGVLRPESDTKSTVRYLRQMLGVFGGKVHLFAVSTPCGEGRMKDEDSVRMWQVGVEVCEAFAA